MKKLLLISFIFVGVNVFGMNSDMLCRSMLNAKAIQAVPCNLCEIASSKDMRLVEKYLADTYCQGDWRQQKEDLKSMDPVESAIRNQFHIEDTVYDRLRIAINKSVELNILQEAQKIGREDVVTFIQANL